MILEYAVPFVVIVLAILLMLAKGIRKRRRRPPTDMTMGFDLTGGLLTVMLFIFGGRK